MTQCVYVVSSYSHQSKNNNLYVFISGKDAWDKFQEMINTDYKNPATGEIAFFAREDVSEQIARVLTGAEDTVYVDHEYSVTLRRCEVQ